MSTTFRRLGYILSLVTGRTVLILPTEAQLANGEVGEETSLDSEIWRFRLASGQLIEIPFSNVKNIFPMGV